MQICPVILELSCIRQLKVAHVARPWGKAHIHMKGALAHLQAAPGTSLSAGTVVKLQTQLILSQNTLSCSW